MTAKEIREYLLSICKQRKLLNRKGFSKRAPSTSDEFVLVIERWLHTYPGASTRGMATFFMNNRDKIQFIIPSPRQNTVQHQKFWEILDFCTLELRKHAVS